MGELRINPKVLSCMRDYIQAVYDQHGEGEEFIEVVHKDLEAARTGDVAQGSPHLRHLKPLFGAEDS